MVDIRSSFTKGKQRKPESNTYASDGLNEDENLLRQPTRSSCAGFKEAKKAYENGTDEVRRLLMQECSIIYECNVCRNMFRSLANFFSHKRKYCKSMGVDEVNRFPDRSSSIFVQTVEPSAEKLLVKSRSTDSSPIPNEKCSNRDLSKVIERLKRVEVSSGSVHNKTMAAECNMKVSSPDLNVSDSVLEFENLSKNTRAVYKTLKMKNDDTSIRSELNGLRHLLENRKNILGSDGKGIVSPTLTSSSSSTGNECEVLPEDNDDTTKMLPIIFCEICKISFRTEKALKVHVEKNHTSTTYVFQCPTCSMTFLQPAAVVRHLANDHKKPMRRIRKMRDTIIKKRIQIGDVQMKGLSREMRLIMNNTKDLKSINSEDLLNGNSITSCTYCLKDFERRATLAAHLKKCMVRKKSVNYAQHSTELSVSNERQNNAKTYNQNFQFNKRRDNKGLDKVNIKQEPQEDFNPANNSSNINQMYENLENQTFGNGLHTVCLENMQIIEDLDEKGEEKQEESKNENTKSNKCSDFQSSGKKTKQNDTVCSHKPFHKEKSKRFRIVSASKQLTCRCKICNKQFNALSNLRRHISMFHYRSRRFGCKLCDYRAFRRYDIVNHLTFVHKIIGERESMAVEYVTVHEIKYSKDDVEGDIVVVNDEVTTSERSSTDHSHKVEKERQNFIPEMTVKTTDEGKSTKVSVETSKAILPALKMDLISSKDKSRRKVIRRKLKKSLEQQSEGKKRPIRNRIKTVNNDFIYDTLPIKEEPKKPTRVALKRGSTVFDEQNNLGNDDFTPPLIKIMPYRLRTEPLMPADKCSIKGVAANVCRNVIHEGLAAPSTLPELPAERPQMRSRLISSSRNDSNAVSVIETSELEAAGLRSTFFDDSFLEKFAKKSNPSFKMKPLLALQHSPLNSILQKFDASQQNNINGTDSRSLQEPSEENSRPPPGYAMCLLQSLKQPVLKEKEATPNRQQISQPLLPPATPKKRITLMQRLAENRARVKTRDNFICTTLDN